MFFFQQHKGLQVEDENQPLLICKAKAKDERGGQEREAWLVPEFCIITGLDEQQRNNMK